MENEVSVNLGQIIKSFDLHGYKGEHKGQENAAIIVPHNHPASKRRKSNADRMDTSTFWCAPRRTRAKMMSGQEGTDLARIGRCNPGGA